MVDTSGLTVGYELLYRDGADATAANFRSPEQASLQVITNTFAGFGVDGVLGSRFGLLNVTRDMLLSDAINVLPPDRVWLEVIAGQVFDAEMVARCRSLRERGYRLALDDYCVDDEREPYLDLFELVKVDLPHTDKRELDGLVAMLRRCKVGVLAQKIESQAEFELCRGLGCELFQGYHFERPQTLTTRKDAEQDPGGLISIV